MKAKASADPIREFYTNHPYPRSVLKQDGAMYLMLYAPYGRTGVAMIQEYCRRLGVGTSPQEVNDLTTVLKAMPHDLYLFIHAQEKQMFDAIDGRRSVAEIVEKAEGAAARASRFFDKLWCHDQVVFDTSQAC